MILCQFSAKRPLRNCNLFFNIGLTSTPTPCCTMLKQLQDWFCGASLLPQTSFEKITKCNNLWGAVARLSAVVNLPSMLSSTVLSQHQHQQHQHHWTTTLDSGLIKKIKQKSIYDTCNPCVPNERLTGQLFSTQSLSMSCIFAYNLWNTIMINMTE